MTNGGGQHLVGGSRAGGVGGNRSGVGVGDAPAERCIKTEGRVHGDSSGSGRPYAVDGPGVGGVVAPPACEWQRVR